MRRRVLGFGECCYHVVSRVNERRFYLGREQKKHFVELLDRVAVFSGVEVLTFCIMDDHFHLLVRVPRPTSISDRELLRRLRVLYKPHEYEALCLEYEQYQQSGDVGMMQAFRQRFLSRMCNLSEFVRTLKHRFSLWYNRRNEREGPLWTGRFKSALVQSSFGANDGDALHVLAAYIDLNAVRAELVERPEDYCWCSFAQAVKGDERRLKAIRFVMGRGRGKDVSARVAMGAYRRLLAKFPAPRVSRLLSGYVIGQHSFVNSVARKRPECFCAGYFDVAEEILSLAGSGLYCIRSFVPRELRRVR